MQKISAYLRLMRFNKPIGILLLLWPTLWALWLATDGKPPTLIVTVFIAGVIIMRAAGCLINDIADRNFDGLVERTNQRPLVTGEVSIKQALALFIFLCLLALGLVLTLNHFTIGLAIVALVLAIIYPFSKRFISFPQFILGIAFNWSIPMAFAATTNTIPNIAWLLYLITLLWTVVYDTQYAMVDREDDLRIGIKSTAIWFGKNDLYILDMLHLFILMGFVFIGFNKNLGLAFWLSLLVAGCLAVYQHRLVMTRQRESYFAAFLNNNWYGAVIFLGIVLGSMTLS